MVEMSITEDIIPVMYKDKEIGFCRRETIDLISGEIAGEIILKPGFTLPKKQTYVSIGWKGNITEDQADCLSKENIYCLTINPA